MPACAFVFAMGAASLIVQSVVVRELLPVVHGTELALGFVFSCWLLWIAVGAALGARLARSSVRPGHRLAGLVVAGTLSPFVEVEIIRHIERWVGMPSGVVLSWRASYLLCLGSLAPFCLVVGLSFPLACRLSAPTRGTHGTHGTTREGASIAQLYMVEAMGALTGGLLFTFVLAERLGHYAILGGAGCVVLGAVSLGLPSRARWGGMGAAFLLLLLSPRLQTWDGHSQRAEISARLPGQKVEAVFDTPYEQVVLASLAEQHTIYGNGSPSATIGDPYEARAFVSSVLAQSQAPRRILVFGNPETGLASALATATRGNETDALPAITFVHPDEKLVSVLRDRWGRSQVPVEGRQVVFDDPRAYLRESAGGFDLVVVDAPEPTNAQINRLYTVEFFVAVARAMKPSGVLALRLPGGSSYNGREISDLLVSVQSGLAGVFAEVVATPGETVYLFASSTAGVLCVDPDVIVRRLSRVPGAEPYLAAIRSDYEPRRMQQFQELLGRSRGAITNSDHHPSSYLYGSVIWDKLSSTDVPDKGQKPGVAREGTRLARAVQLVSALRGRHVVICVLFALLLSCVMRRLAPRALAAASPAVSVFVAGFSAMAQELVLLIEYQSACGALYERLAVVSGSFMLGIAIGSFALGPVARAHDAQRVTRIVLLADCAFSLLLARVFPGLSSLSTAWEQIVYFSLFLLAGALLGGVVAASAESLARASGTATGAHVARIGAVVDAADHAGATLAAFTIGALVLPALGSVATLSFVGLFGVTGAISCWLAPR